MNLDEGQQGRSGISKMAVKSDLPPEWPQKKCISGQFHVQPVGPKDGAHKGIGSRDST
jgi:hypothetical protein